MRETTEPRFLLRGVVVERSLRVVPGEVATAFRLTPLTTGGRHHPAGRRFSIRSNAAGSSRQCTGGAVKGLKAMGFFTGLGNTRALFPRREKFHADFPFARKSPCVRHVA